MFILFLFFVFCFQIFGGIPCLKALKLVLPPISNSLLKLAKFTPNWQKSHQYGKLHIKLAKLQMNWQKSAQLCKSHIELAKQEPYF